MVGLAFSGNIDLSRTTEGKFCSSRLDIPIPSNSEFSLERYGREENEHSVFENCEKLDMRMTDANNRDDSVKESKLVDIAGRSMPEKYKTMPTKILRWSFNDVIHACAQTHDAKLAEQLILQMQDLGLEPSCRTYDGFIRAIVFERGLENGMEVLKEMRGRNLKPYGSTFATLSISCSKALELDLAEAFLDQIDESQHVHPFNAFLAACDVLDLPERAVRMLSKMKRLKLQPDIRTYELLFSLFGNVNAPYEEGNILSQVDAAKRINAIEMDMMKSGIQHSFLSMRNLLKALGAEGMIPEQLQYLRMAENQFSRGTNFLGTAIYNTVLHSLVEAKESSMVIEIFRSMKLHGFLPDAVTYNIMINCCGIIECYKSACALVSLMVRDGYGIHTVTYTALIKILLEYEDFDAALNLLDQASAEANPDVVLYNTILQRASVKGRIDIIELLVEKMHRGKIQPDPCTCYNVYTTYIEQGYLTTGIEALQVLSMRMISEEEDNLQGKRIEFEELIANEDVEAESAILKQFFRNFNENIAAALLNLRWCAIMGFSINWFSDQSPWSKRLSSSYSGRTALRSSEGE